MKNSFKKNPGIVCIGGGTGVSMILSGLKKYPVNLSAIVTMFDGGAGSTGKLRDELGILPPGDIRQCLAALSVEPGFAEFFNYRFNKGVLRGHSLGNLFIAAAEKFTGSFGAGIKKLRKILKFSGVVIPVTLNNSNLKAILKNGKMLGNEDAIVNCKDLSRAGIKRLFLDPQAKINPEADLAIRKADLIVIGPGKFYTSLIPNLLVKGVKEAIKSSKAKKVFVCNLMTQSGNTDNLKVKDFVGILEEYLGDSIDYAIFNTGKLTSSLKARVEKVFPGAKLVGYDRAELPKSKFIGENILDKKIRKMNPSDVFIKGANQRTMVLHDSNKLAKILLKLCKQ
ncbi:MAG: YvcK family protein [Candidatus Pacebacteria bacterium]|nr:YvcK family protein [Candidatus Paceibacterota bacterium]